MPAYRWNRIGLTTPDDWEPRTLERDGFLLEQNGSPMCELKWRHVHGRFSFAKHMKRLAKEHKGVDMQAVDNGETPAVWQASLNALAKSGIRLKSFIWQSRRDKGMGAVLHNPSTGLAALIQFFVDATDATDSAAAVLSSFRDYSAGKTVPWAMFGLAARVPSTFALHTFSFKPGHYAVKYWQPRSRKNRGRIPAGKGPGVALTFERFAPASVLLKTASLDEWASTNLEHAIPLSLVRAKSLEALEWNGVARTSTLRRLLRRQTFDQGRIWTTDKGNAILCVRAEGAMPMDESTFSEIKDSYGVV